MSGLKRFWLGGSGALLPLLITLMGADLAVLIDQHDQLTTGMIIGAGIRYLCLFILGGAVAALHSDERKPLKLVQLGIAAPALITSYISVGPANATGTHAFHIPGIVGSAYAAEMARDRLSQQGELTLASGILSDIFKGWSQPLDRTVRQTARIPDDAKPSTAAEKPAKSKPRNKLEKRRQTLLEQKKKIERELKSLEKTEKK